MIKNKIAILMLLSLWFTACKEEKKPEAQKPTATVEIDHSTEPLLKVDTVIAGNIALQYSLEKVPVHFVMAQKQGENGLEMHIYQDVYLQVRFKDKTYILTKDSLLKHVNKEYLQEALIGNVVFDYYQPTSAGEEFHFLLEVKKPAEDFTFPFEWIVSPAKYETKPIDE